MHLQGYGESLSTTWTIPESLFVALYTCDHNVGPIPKVDEEIFVDPLLEPPFAAVPKQCHYHGQARNLKKAHQTALLDHTEQFCR